MSTSPSPYPSDPLPWRRLRVTDANRNQVIDLLSNAYTDGRLDPTEFDERSSRALRAVIFEDLVPLVTDLVPGGMVDAAIGCPAPTPPATNAAPVPTAPVTVMNVTNVPPGTRFVPAVPQSHPRFVMFSSYRTAPARVGSYFDARALFADYIIDLSQVVFEAPQLTLSVSAYCATVTIIVPDQVTVTNDATVILGDFKDKRRSWTRTAFNHLFGGGTGHSQPGQTSAVVPGNVPVPQPPVNVVITGLAVFGEIRVKSP